jgi:hypothetical protein
MVPEMAKHEENRLKIQKVLAQYVKHTSAWYRQDGHRQKCWRQLACSSLLPPLSLPTKNHVKQFKAKRCKI